MALLSTSAAGERDRRLLAVTSCLESTGVVEGEFGIVNALREQKAEVSSWIVDDRPQVKVFAERLTRELANLIASEQRRADQMNELTPRQFDVE